MTADLEARLAELREAFDASFAAPRPGAPPPLEDLLLVRAGSERLALRLSELAGIERDRKVVSVPGAAAAGVASVRGKVVAVASLAVLLDAERDPAERWLALAKDAPLALAFSALEGQRPVPRGSLVPLAAPRFAHAREVVVLEGGEQRPVASVPSLVSSVRSAARPPEERAS